MTLTAGTRLGSYEITGPLGKGGMGEVYRATDTRLGREVAIKTLPALLADDADRLERFEREAKLLASLNHAHIASVYGLDEHEGSLYIAMELVEGETLEARLRGGQLRVEQALDLGLQIANALEAAHGKGVIHRDLKPANVMITPDGVVKVLDFGLAKAFSGDPNEESPAHSPALSLAMTQQGLVLGTAGYMSPEQASGQATDQRADIWAFGVLLYEMLTGLPVFSGESVPHILAGVLRADPDWDKLPRDLHPRVREMLERCLEKKLRDRYHSMADVRVDIEKALLDPRGRSVAMRIERPLVRRVLPVGIAVLAAFAVASVAAWLIWPSPDKALTRFTDEFELGSSANAQLFRSIAISPDGRRYVFGTADGFYLREMDAENPRLISGTDQRHVYPIFSQYGDQFAVFSREPLSLRRIAVDGGTTVQIAPIVTPSPSGGQWNADGSIVYAVNEGIFRVPAAGGEPESLVVPEDGERLTDPSLLPDGQTVLFTSMMGRDTDTASIVTRSLVSGERKTVIENGFAARYVPTGHIVYALEGGLYGIAFDLDALSVRGGTVPLIEDLVVTRAGSAQYDIADGGTLIYQAGASPEQVGATSVVWVDRQGRPTPIEGLPSKTFYAYVQISPDGRKLALDVRGDENDISIFDLERGNLQRLTFDEGMNRGPVWLDSEHVIFSRQAEDSEELFVMAANGSGVPEPLTSDSGFPAIATAVTDQVLLVTRANDPSDIYMWRLDAESTRIEPLLATPAMETNAQLSPNGRFMAYQFRESPDDEWEIYVRTFPDVDGGGLWQVSTDGGTRPLWSPDGSELFFLSGENGDISLMSAAVETDASFRFDSPERLFGSDFLLPRLGRQVYDVSPDGERFLFIVPYAGDTRQSIRINVVQNWLEELKERVPVD